MEGKPITYTFNELTKVQQQEVLDMASQKINSSPRVIEMYKYIWHKMDEGKDSLCIPAMLIPAMLDMSYIGKDAQKDYVRHFLKVHGDENRNWIFHRKKDIFSNLSNYPPIIDNVIKYELPGKPDAEPIYISKNAHYNRRWPFVTPEFALNLVIIGKGSVSAHFNLLSSEICKICKTIVPKNQWDNIIEEANGNIDIELVNSLYEDNDERHNLVRDFIAQKYNGKVEVRNLCGVCDVETKTAIFEVKPVNEWKHGVGQVISYQYATNKTPVLVLYGDKKPRKHVYEVCRSQRIQINFVRLQK